MSGIFALYTTTRCTLDQVGWSASAPFWAGGVAVAVPYALEPARADYLRNYVKDAVKMPMGRGLAVAMSAFSGSVVFGSADSLLRWAGIGW